LTFLFRWAKSMATRSIVSRGETMKHVLSATLCLFALAQLANAQSISHVGAPANLTSSAYPGAVSTMSHTGIPSKLLTGTVQVAIKLQDPPLVVAVGANAKQNGITMTAAQQRAYLAQIAQKQDAVMSQVSALGGVELARVSKAHNALIVSIDASRLQALHGISGVVAVRPVADYQLSATPVPDLPTTDAYVGATAVQQSGFTGAGVRVALLDTGIDYTHYNLGGSGNIADYTAAVAVAGGTPPVNLFPTSKVVGGFDFTGDTWNGSSVTTLTPDPNPIDQNGHGSHTADILGGRSLDNLHLGTAPGAQLYAVKVCSSVSTACSGVAILEGIDFALDPTNSGTLNNAVDVISMSIGQSFGMREDDDSEAFTDVVNFGVVSVISAGNDGDIPYILAGPAATPEVLALAATTSVVATGIPLVINSPPSIAGTYANTAQLDFAPINAAVTSNLAYIGRGCPAGSISSGSPADPYLANPSGKIALIDRGACAVSLKIDAAARAGATGVLIGLVAPGDAISFSNGGGSDFVATLVITQSTSTLLKNALGSSAVNGTISPNNAISLASNVASFSSRGPNYSYNMLKPDMSAPGTITAAQPGTGNGVTTESGTSFSCPLTAGSAALLLSKNHALGPLDIKALLMESSEPSVFENAATEPGVLAPMSRMGAGELRADRAAAATTSVWDASDPLAVSISFGTYRVNTPQSFKKKIVVKNYSSAARTYQITNTYRDAPNLTGVTITAPSSIFVPANSAASFTLTLNVIPASLPIWTLNGGSLGGAGELLNTVEYAGFLGFTSGAENVHIPWHILPHKAANVTPASSSVALNGNPANLSLSNVTGAVNGLVDAFSLTGTGTQFPASVLPAPGSDFAVINLRAVGVRLVCLDNACAALGAQFAVTTFGQRSHPDVPAEFDVLIDVDGDGIPDLDIFNGDIGIVTTGTAFSGQNAVFVADLAAGTASGPFFYTVADLDSANAILTVPLSALQTAAGLKLNFSTPFTFSVLAFDNYFTGNLTDLIGPMAYELDMPQFYAASDELSVPAGSSAPLTIVPNNAANPFFSGPYNGMSPSQTGLLLMYTDGKVAREVDPITVTP
jgi:subtilisin family serine protease